MSKNKTIIGTTPGNTAKQSYMLKPILLSVIYLYEINLVGYKQNYD